MCPGFTDKKDSLRRKPSVDYKKLNEGSLTLFEKNQGATGRVDFEFSSDNDGLEFGAIDETENTS